MTEDDRKVLEALVKAMNDNRYSVAIPRLARAAHSALKRLLAEEKVL